MIIKESVGTNVLIMIDPIRCETRYDFSYCRNSASNNCGKKTPQQQQKLANNLSFDNCRLLQKVSWKMQSPMCP